MAILTVSRQIASLGDELCFSIAQKLNYRFVSRKDIEKRILELGFSEKKLRKFDEKKPGFFASLSRDRDEYLDYLQTAMYEAALQDNCVIIGRGSFIILKDLPNHISLKFVSEKNLRIQRYQDEHGCSKKYAEKIVNESDANRKGFHKSFFNFDQNNPAMYHLVVNTGLISSDAICDTIESLVKTTIKPEDSQHGKEKLEELLFAQQLSMEFARAHNMEIRFLHTKIKENKIYLHGITDSNSKAAKAVEIAAAKFPDYEVCSSLTIDKDFK
ncbi:MAG: cytidylate kinase-like family protein [Treponema sp.]|nr:cytidylate kinase-like family protein [Candidatus Treponema equifaecale]